MTSTMTEGYRIRRGCRMQEFPRPRSFPLRSFRARFLCADPPALLPLSLPRARRVALSHCPRSCADAQRPGAAAFDPSGLASASRRARAPLSVPPTHPLGAGLQTARVPSRCRFSLKLAQFRQEIPHGKKMRLDICRILVDQPARNNELHVAVLHLLELVFRYPFLQREEVLPRYAVCLI